MSGVTATRATVAAAVIALVSGVGGAMIATQASRDKEATGKSVTLLQIEDLRARADLDLERSKQLAADKLAQKQFEATLILEAIKTPSRTDAIRNLKFFVTAGFIADPGGKISSLGEESLPSISDAAPDAPVRTTQATGVVYSRAKDGTYACTGVSISQVNVIASTRCIKDAFDINFKVAGRLIPLTVLASAKRSTPDIALLRVASADHLDAFVDRSKIRDPLPGERVYLASIGGDQNSIVLETCQVIENMPFGNRFRDNCERKPGSSGAVVIAISDDSLLGISYDGVLAQGIQAGVASRLTKVMTDWGALISPAISSAP